MSLTGLAGLAGEDEQPFEPDETRCAWCGVELAHERGPSFRKTCNECGRDPSWFQHTEHIVQKEIRKCRDCSEPFVTSVSYMTSFFFRSGENHVEHQGKKGRVDVWIRARCRACLDEAQADFYRRRVIALDAQAIRIRAQQKNGVAIFRASEAKVGKTKSKRKKKASS